MDNNRILIVIPARGGSKGIPRKNLRTLVDKPLLAYSLDTAQAIRDMVSSHVDICLTSDDDEILALGLHYSVISLKRNSNLADDETTLDSVVFNAVNQIEEKLNVVYDVVVTLQPTSPLLSASTLFNAIERFHKEKLETLISTKDDRHLTWIEKDNQIVPNYTKRVNRQYLPSVYRETGAFLITRRNLVRENSRIGAKMGVFNVPEREEVDVDSYADWAICEYYLKQSKIVFFIRCYKEIGYGHLFRALTIANSILNHQIIFLFERQSLEGFNIVKSRNYSCYLMNSQEDVAHWLTRHSPALVINDILDTQASFIKSLKKANLKVINFEDLGEGAKYADVVINALYPEMNKLPRHFYGYEYFIARDEFFLIDEKTSINRKVKEVLITFGGTDPNNLTIRVLDSILSDCISSDINITVILGLGYSHDWNIDKYEGVTFLKDVKNISTYIKKADLIFCSGGRTVYEIAILRTPTIVLCQNERELTHLFASSENGFINLGLGSLCSLEFIAEIFDEVKSSFLLREQSYRLMKRINLKSGRERILKIINDTIHEN